MARLAIKGHPTRGKEVIEILEMLGGTQSENYLGNGICWCYTIIGGEIDWDNPSDKYKVFTLEEFLEKFPYKVGDKVLINDYEDDVYTIKTMVWDDDFNRVKYKIEAADGMMDSLDWFAHEMIFVNHKKEETMEGKIGSFEILESHCANEVKIEFDPSKFEIVKRDNGYYVVKKQPQYPKTYDECREMLGIPKDMNIAWQHPILGYEIRLLADLQKLLICRASYWKIAGDWEPNFREPFLYAIGMHFGVVEKIMVVGRGFLVFPTEEMRDVFFENFKELIEACKRLI